MPSLVRVALLGTAHPHIFHRYNFLASRADIRLIGYYEEDEEIAERMQGFAGCQRFSNLNELLAADFDVAMIHGLDRDNGRYIMQAIGAGAKGIFLEKPGMGQPSEFLPILNQIRLHETVFEVGWELHYTSSIAFARSVIRDNLLGIITTARFHGGCPGGAGQEVWQSDPMSIGGFFYSLGGHTVETVIDLFGLPQMVSASIRKLPRKESHTGFSWVPTVFSKPVRDPVVAVGSLYHEDIASAILEYEHFNVNLDLTAWESNRYCEEWSIDIYGTNGTLHLVPDPPSAILTLKESVGRWSHGTHNIFQRNQPGASVLDEAFQRQMNSFFDRLAGREIPITPCHEDLVSQLSQLYIALYTSAKERSWQIP